MSRTSGRNASYPGIQAPRPPRTVLVEPLVHLMLQCYTTIKKLLFNLYSLIRRVAAATLQSEDKGAEGTREIVRKPSHQTLSTPIARSGRVLVEGYWGWGLYFF